MMAGDNITIQELYDSHQVSLIRGSLLNSGSVATRNYLVRGTNDEIIACQRAYALAPPYIIDNETDLRLYRIPKYSVSVSERCDDTTWKVAVEYRYTQQSVNTDDIDENETEVRFQCASGGSRTVRYGEDHRLLYKESDFTPPCEDLNEIPIGWDGKTRDVESTSGVSLPSLELREEYTKKYKYKEIRKASWKRKIAEAFGKVNSDKFKGWEPGEVMFLGASYTAPERGNEIVTVTYSFSIRVNEKDVDVFGHKVDSLPGHDVIWAGWTERVSQSGPASTRLKFIMAARVCKRYNFDAFGLGD